MNMKFGTLLLLTGTVLGAPAYDKRGNNAPSLPTNANGIVQFVDDIVTYTVNLLWNNMPMWAIAGLLPEPNIEFDADLLFLNSGGIPNYSANFDPVDGVDSSKVKWAVEAENRTPEDPVILYFHGGGYCLGLYPTYYQDFIDIYKDTGNDRLSILVLDYTLTTEKVYPTQFQEAFAVYNQLAKSSNNIIVEGDSAGGHLAVELMRNIKYPYGGGVPAITQKPTALILISPWLDIYPNPDNGTMVSNANNDILNAAALRGMGEMFVPNNETLRTSSELNPFKDYIDWGDILPDYSNVWVSYGTREVLKSSVEQWLDLANLQNSSATIIVDQGGQHDPILFTKSATSYWNQFIDFHKKVTSS